MKRIAALITGILLACGLVAGTAGPAAADTWRSLKGPTLLPPSAVQHAAASAPDNLWTSGLETIKCDPVCDEVGETGKPFLRQWNGAKWIDHRPAGLLPAHIRAIKALSPADVWIAGGRNSPLIAHWDGTAWSSPPLPLEPTGVWTTVEARPDAVWVAANTRDEGLIYRRAGGQWLVTRLPGLTVHQIVSRSATDVWALAATRWDPAYSGDVNTLLRSTDGRTWQQVSVPGLTSASRLTGLAVSGGSEVWLSGRNGTAGFLKRFDGSAWQDVADPAGFGGGRALAADANGAVWTVGGNKIHRYQGGAWTEFAAPLSGTTRDVILREVTVVPGTSQVYAVGQGLGLVAQGPYIATNG
ncbi:hypothetical protein [Bailinhaonella thermotolerans]|uniref:Photosynthesis system II assembly factor Ycf48/Hcf136-like domain-containing protein n=1 Tax=Bailinhaonella thermotolerans TaxID=1070861 RepID=A0A3A4BEF0_9ACTN|nr:hypothetical protein [Bailinhaonella thermotolerans]RJL32690.1 hypothetical protein D5H75_14450 [Bailinhaonella thermotolerans]